MLLLPPRARQPKASPKASWYTPGSSRCSRRIGAVTSRRSRCDRHLGSSALLCASCCCCAAVRLLAWSSFGTVGNKNANYLTRRGQGPFRFEFLFGPKMRRDFQCGEIVFRGSSRFLGVVEEAKGKRQKKKFFYAAAHKANDPQEARPRLQAPALTYQGGKHASI